MDLFGQVLRDFFNKNQNSTLWIHNNYGEPEEMPVEVFFRDKDTMPQLELFALSLCKGKILDIGAGVGSHALILQDRGLDISALEISPIACQIMELRGVKNVINQNVMDYQAEKFDTILLLMNGIGLNEDLNGLKAFLNQAKQLINPGGQLLFDSSDITYLYEDIPLPKGKYYGELSYHYEYKKQKGDWFKWLYIDQETLIKIAKEQGWQTEILFEDEMDQYLARLVLE